MNYPILDESIKTQLNALTVEEINSCTTYGHEILWYGIDALTHVQVMRNARDIVSKKISVDDLMNKYSLYFKDELKKNNDQETLDKLAIDCYLFVGKFTCSLEQIEKSGIFLPQQTYWKQFANRKRVNLFDSDYVNFQCHFDVQELYAHQHLFNLIKHKWTREDLKNSDLIEKGIQFGQMIWDCSMSTFQKSKNESKSKLVVDLAEELIKHYDLIIHSD